MNKLIMAELMMMSLIYTGNLNKIRSKDYPDISPELTERELEKRIYKANMQRQNELKFISKKMKKKLTKSR